jgi:hypothetical protein
MRRIFVGAAIVAVAAVAAALGHLAVIEIGREVATLRTIRPDGTVQETRLWIVDDGPSAWLHSGGPDWSGRFAGDPIVEVERENGVFRYRAHAMPGPHPHVDRLLRAKYGNADRWVRFLSPDGADTVAVRLDPAP